MDHQSFEAQLEQLIGRPTNLRPFVCDGSPLKCEVFIVGFNATTEVDFWSFWDSQTGFDKRNWEAAYRNERIRKGKRENSPTRSMIGWILDDLPGVSVLETNIYAKATPAMTDLPQKERNIAPFRFLLQTIQPKLVLAHGDKTIAAIQPLIEKSGLSTKLLPTKHFRFWSKQRAQELANTIKLALE